jgi:hypothetical protein
VGARRALESATSRSVRQLTLRSASAATLVHSQHRYPPRPPSLQSYSPLPAVARAARPPRTAPGQPRNTPGKLSVCTACVMGRGAAPLGVFPRNQSPRLSGNSVKSRRTIAMVGRDSCQSWRSSVGGRAIQCRLLAPGSDKIQSEEVCRLVGIIGLGARSAVASGRPTRSRAILGCNSLKSRKTSA